MSIEAMKRHNCPRCEQEFFCNHSPPQHEWVGLTDEEITEIDQGLDARSYSMFAYTRAIEAKLKEKNT